MEYIFPYRGRILGRNWDKSQVLRVFLLAIYSHLTDFTPSPLLSKSGLKLVCNVNIVLKSENSQD
jgi:hypothetical protein